LKASTLYIVSTPIGNLEDITLRALKVLKEVDVIAAEDTRHSRKLLTHYGISKPLVSYWGEKEKIRAEDVLERLKAGQDVALISDAGTPGISDPGAVLIKKAIDEGINVVPIPGPSALIAAISISGLPTERFIFIGFLPARHVQRKKVLQELAFEDKTLIFYEAPHRVLETLTDMEYVLGNRRVTVIRELTKLHEEILRGNISDVLDEMEERTIAGEYVIVVEGRLLEGKPSDVDALLEISALMKKGLGRKEAVKMVAGSYGLSKKELYDKSLKKSEK